MKWLLHPETNVRGFTSRRWLSSNAERSVPWKGGFMAHVSPIRLDNTPSFSEQSTRLGWGETSSYSGWYLSAKQNRVLPVPGKTAPCDQTSQVWVPGWSGVFSSKKQPGRELPTTGPESFTRGLVEWLWRSPEGDTVQGFCRKSGIFGGNLQKGVRSNLLELLLGKQQVLQGCMYPEKERERIYWLMATNVRMYLLTFAKRNAAKTCRR